jgi:putative flippase GtrA
MAMKVDAAHAGRMALIGQLFRYALTGGLASLVNIGIYWGLARFAGLDPNLAWTIGFVAAVLVGYVVHSRWSFRGHGRRGNLVRTGGRFIIVSLVSFGLNSFWVWLLVQYLGGPTWWPIPPVLMVTPLFVFTLNRRWVFD